MCQRLCSRIFFECLSAADSNEYYEANLYNANYTCHTRQDANAKTSKDLKCSWLAKHSSSDLPYQCEHLLEIGHPTAIPVSGVLANRSFASPHSRLGSILWMERIASLHLHGQINQPLRFFLFLVTSVVTYLLWWLHYRLLQKHSGVCHSCQRTILWARAIMTRIQAGRIIVACLLENVVVEVHNKHQKKWIFSQLDPADDLSRQEDFLSCLDVKGKVTQPQAATIHILYCRMCCADYWCTGNAHSKILQARHTQYRSARCHQIHICSHPLCRQNHLHNYCNEMKITTPWCLCCYMSNMRLQN